MSFITTYTKKYFDPLNVDESLLDIKDIAHALSLICRGNGHVQYFYSVAQHSLACAKEAKARGYSKEVILGCLLHDGSEVYLSDVTRPIKKELTYYLEVEDVLQNVIWKHFIQRDLTKEETKLVFEIDDEGKPIKDSTTVATVNKMEYFTSYEKPKTAGTATEGNSAVSGNN